MTPSALQKAGREFASPDSLRIVDIYALPATCASPQTFGVSKHDRIKEELGWLKVVFALLVAVDVSFVGWLAENYQSTAQLIVICAFMGVIFTTAIVVWVSRAAMRRFKALEEE